MFIKIRQNTDYMDFRESKKIRFTMLVKFKHLPQDELLVKLQSVKEMVQCFEPSGQGRVRTMELQG